MDQREENLKIHDKWVCKGILAIWKFQTEDEQESQQTVLLNGVGFNGFDAELLSSFAEQYSSRDFLSQKQIKIGRRRILKYSGQLTMIAKGEI